MSDIIKINVRGFELKLKTKPGVFAKGELDAGSKLLIDHLEIMDENPVIADLGCGSGIIGIVAAKIAPKAHVHLFDTDIRIIQLANENIALNNLKNVEVYLSDLFFAVGKRKYDVILCNPPQHLGKKFLQESAKECFLHIKPNGEVWWVVQNFLVPFVKIIFTQFFNNWEIVTRSSEYVVIKTCKNL